MLDMWFYLWSLNSPDSWEYNIAMAWAAVYIRRALSFLPGGEMVSLRSLVPSLGVRILPRQPLDNQDIYIDSQCIIDIYV